jgi:hypothetical protein
MKKTLIALLTLTIFVGIVKADLLGLEAVKSQSPVYAKFRVNGNCPSCDDCPSCPKNSDKVKPKNDIRSHLRYRYIEKYNYDKNRKGIENFNYNERLSIRGKGMKPDFSPIPKNNSNN